MTRSSSVTTTTSHSPLGGGAGGGLGGAGDEALHDQEDGDGHVTVSKKEQGSTGGGDEGCDAPCDSKAAAAKRAEKKLQREKDRLAELRRERRKEQVLDVKLPKPSKAELARRAAARAAAKRRAAADRQKAAEAKAASLREDVHLASEQEAKAKAAKTKMALRHVRATDKELRNVAEELSHVTEDEKAHARQLHKSAKRGRKGTGTFPGDPTTVRTMTRTSRARPTTRTPPNSSFDSIRDYARPPAPETVTASSNKT